jgi:two-component system sensor histidine kinase YesM
MRPLKFQLEKKPNKAPRASSLYMKLRSRFTIYFFLLVLLPFAAITAAAWLYTHSLVEKGAFELASAQMEQEKNSIEKYINDLKPVVQATADSLKPDRSGDPAALLKSAVEKNLAAAQLRTLSAAYIINGDGIEASYGADSETAAISSPASQHWFHSAVTEPGTLQVLGTIQRFYDEGRSRMVFSMAIAAPASPGKDAGSVLLFDFNYNLLSDFAACRGASGANSSERLIIDFEGNVLYSRNQGQLTTAADETLLSEMGSLEKGFRKVEYGGRSYYMSFVRYPSLSWIFINLNPESNVSAGFWTRNPLLIALASLLLLILFAYLFLTLRLMNPINELTTVISDYESQLPGVNGQPPLLRQKPPDAGVGAHSDIDFLINKIYSIKLRQKEAELNSLQNQINPHFLYNTLESIRGAALYHGIHEIAAMSKALSLLFRYSISDRVLVTIKEELQHLENYMSIQNFRYENKFELAYSIAPELMNHKILKLTMQPLIENSIKHGLEMKLGKGTIKIEILELDKNIKILISDNGLGMPSKKVDELNRSIAWDRYLSNSEPTRSGTGIGVRNVNSRIKLYFGEQYGLRFREASVGTIVEIILPAVADN